MQNPDSLLPNLTPKHNPKQGTNKPEDLHSSTTSTITSGKNRYKRNIKQIETKDDKSMPRKHDTRKKTKYPDFVFRFAQAARTNTRRGDVEWRVTDPIKDRTPFLRALCGLWGLTKEESITTITHAIENLVNQEN